MKIPSKIIILLLFIASIGLNVCQFRVKHPLSPSTGSSINSATRTKDMVKKSFRIAAYNIRGGKGLDGVRDINRTASVLTGFDIIALNEVLGESPLSNSNQAKELADILGMGWLFLPSQERYYKEYFGNGFLSAFNVTYWYKEQLLYDEEKSNCHRNLTTIQFVIKGKAVTLFLTHLDRGEIRDTQLSYVINKFKQCDNHCILIGDLNSRRKDPQLIELLKAENTIDAINVALDSKRTMKRLDWIIVKGFKIVDGGLTPEGISDHPLYWVELELMERKP
jgi:endonuclease/exonuclease/phosphatase family metal-dependent hydrolase